MRGLTGGVKLEDEAGEFWVSMTEFDRLNGCIERIDLSFVERERTSEWAIQVAIRCHLTFISTRNASQFLYELGVQLSHVAVRNWVYEATTADLDSERGSARG